MKAREPDIKVQRWVAMLQAADLIERGRYRFGSVQIPRSCHDYGCVLGWVGYAAGFKLRLGIDTCSALDDVAHWLGYRSQWHFYDSLDGSPASVFWRHDPVLAATTLRKLAEEMT